MTITTRRRIVGLMLATLAAGACAVAVSGVLAMKHTRGDVFKEIDYTLAGP